MKKYKQEILVMSVFMAIPVLVLMISLFKETDCESFVGLLWIWQTLFHILSSIVSLVLIRAFHIQIKNVYKKTLKTIEDILLDIVPTIVIMFLIRKEFVSAAIAIIFPIFSAFLIAKKVRLILKEHGGTEIEMPKLSHILAITFINPLLPFLPTLMAFAYALAHFEISL